jgi:kumamolisin
MGTEKGVCKPYFRQRATGAGQGSSWSVPDLCAAYNWPTGLTGGGVIGIIELNGGWTQSDIDAYFSSIGQPSPSIQDVFVDSTTNNPNQHNGQDDDPDLEVALDIEVAGAAYFVATGKPATIRVYWARDFQPAIEKAMADGVDVFSISWGASEIVWKQRNWDLAGLDTAVATASGQGMVVFSASGDHDSSDAASTAHSVDGPASCPHVIGCGGTKKTHTSETVWNDNPGDASGQGTGGGFSQVFPTQGWQAGAPQGPGRMVPDVAANADVMTGYEIIVHGRAIAPGGTSAVAPLYAGLFAAFGTKLGFIGPKLWGNHLCFNDITEGDNGYYRAAPGPDPCTGLGSPIGVKLAALFGVLPAPQSAARLRSYVHAAKP